MKWKCILYISELHKVTSSLSHYSMTHDLQSSNEMLRIYLGVNYTGHKQTNKQLLHKLLELYLTCNVQCWSTWQKIARVWPGGKNIGRIRKKIITTEIIWNVSCLYEHVELHYTLLLPFSPQHLFDESGIFVTIHGNLPLLHMRAISLVFGACYFPFPFPYLLNNNLCSTFAIPG